MDEEYEEWNPAPSLVDLCINTAVDNLRHLGDVGETDFDLLRRILRHCTLEQLMRVEKSTKGRDLSPVTNELWMQFYQKEFGKAETNKQMEKMKRRKAACRWKKLYEEKQQERLENENVVADRLKRRYEEEVARKQSRQIQVCTKVPPSSKKRSWGNGGYNVTGKNNLMKKAKLDFLKSNEVRNLAAMKKNALPKSYSAPPVKKPVLFPERDSASSSKQIRPVERTFKRLPF